MNTVLDLKHQIEELSKRKIDVLGSGINDIRLAPNFKLSEFQCNGNKCGCRNAVKINPEVVRRLQLMRDEVNAPIIINSGYRCPIHDVIVGGEGDGQHVHGRAADFIVVGFSINDARLLAEKYFFDGGIGVYNNHIHVDTGRKRRW